MKITREEKIKNAKAAQAQLRADGHMMHAEAIRAIIAAHGALTETTRRLWADNMALRENE